MEDLYLEHHGVLGMHWGVRRYQNKDGTLTAAGAKRYRQNDKTQNNSKDHKGLSDKQKKVLKIGAAVAGTALVTYGGYKLAKYTKNAEAVKVGKEAAEKILHDQKNLSILVAETKAKDSFKDVKSATKRVGDMIWTYEKNPSPGVKSKEMIYNANNKVVQNSTNATKNALKNEYLMKNIANTQSHIDPTTAVRNSEKYQHAYNSTLKSRTGSIKGDRKLYGEKAVEGRNAAKEAKNFVDNATAYQMHRGGIYGYGWEGDIEKQTAAAIQERVNKMKLLNESMSSIINNTYVEDYTSQLLKKTRL